jgi:ribonuclease-3
MSDRDEESLEERLEYRFQRSELLRQALTHRSAIGDTSSIGTAGDNELLEFLGDAVLGLLASEHLLTSFPEWSEGQLSRSRSRIVSAPSLESAARRLELGNHLRLGRGEEKTGGRQKPGLLADAFEAIVGAVYLDGGLNAAREFLRRKLFEHTMEERGARLAESDYKSALQEYLQGRGQLPAEYRLAGESGPDHRKVFRVEVWVESECRAAGEGNTKKEAEQQAARRTLERLVPHESGG